MTRKMIIGMSEWDDDKMTPHLPSLSFNYVVHFTLRERPARLVIFKQATIRMEERLGRPRVIL